MATARISMSRIAHWARAFIKNSYKIKGILMDIGKKGNVYL
ncbi:hypothetical protein PAJ34TS1_31980 [Paenibacillus azoreducens]